VARRADVEAPAFRGVARRGRPARGRPTAASPAGWRGFPQHP